MSRALASAALVTACCLACACAAIALHAALGATPRPEGWRLVVAVVVAGASGLSLNMAAYALGRVVAQTIRGRR